MACQEEMELEKLIGRKRPPTSDELASLAITWLRRVGEPTDILHALIAMKSIKQLWQEKGGEK